MNIVFATASIMLAGTAQIVYGHLKSVTDFYPYAAIITYAILIWYSLYAFYFYSYFRKKTKKKKNAIGATE